MTLDEQIQETTTELNAYNALTFPVPRVTDWLTSVLESLQRLKELESVVVTSDFFNHKMVKYEI